MQSSRSWIPLAISLMLTLSGCSTFPSESPTTSTSKVTLVTRPDLNPDGSGRPSPVPVRIYLLRNADKLSRADYFQIIDHERDVLGPDLISRQELVVRPGQSQVVVLQGQGQEAAVGVVVGYRDIERARWRVISPLSHNGELTVTLNATAVSVENVY
jgi:type VI secretion system protein VasD